MIGYSGYDDAVRALLRESEQPLHHLCVVSDTAENARKTETILTRDINPTSNFQYYEGGFATFARMPNLAGIIQRIVT